MILKIILFITAFGFQNSLANTYIEEYVFITECTYIETQEDCGILYAYPTPNHKSDGVLDDRVANINENGKLITLTYSNGKYLGEADNFYITGNSVNVRDTPDGEWNYILNDGDEVSVLRNYNNWSLVVDGDGSYGWVSNEFISSNASLTTYAENQRYSDPSTFSENPALPLLLILALVLFIIIIVNKRKSLNNNKNIQQKKEYIEKQSDLSDIKMWGSNKAKEKEFERRRLLEIKENELKEQRVRLLEVERVKKEKDEKEERIRLDKEKQFEQERVNKEKAEREKQFQVEKIKKEKEERIRLDKEKQLEQERVKKEKEDKDRKKKEIANREKKLISDLENLKKLFDDGLIDEDIYHEKQKDILDRS